MRRSEKRNELVDLTSSGTFSIQVYSNEARLINEYTLDGAADDISSLHVAEQHARRSLHKNLYEPLVLVVSEETLTEFNQVQIRVPATRSRTGNEIDRRDNGCEQTQ